ncbi:MAG: zinc-binding dehydrogenase [Acidimicrobiales bacterium]
MQAAVLIDGRLEIQQRPTPEPGPGDVLVAVAGAGVNAADLMQRRGQYPAPPGWPVDVPGLELAGVVTAVGPGVDVELIGRRVCAIVGGGAQATHCVVPSEHLVAVADSIDLAVAGGFPEAFVTAHDALVTQAGAGAGDRVLISGAAGGVGSAAVQIAARRGAHVIAVTRTTEFHDQLRGLGASETITIDQVATRDPVDVVIELVGAAHLQHALRVLAARARVVVIGVGGGGRVELDLLSVMNRRATITGSTLRARSRDEKALVIQRASADLLDDWASGRLQVPVARIVDFADIATAYDYFAEPGKFGKVLVHIP